jgi:hypothetical protein
VPGVIPPAPHILQELRIWTIIKKIATMMDLLWNRMLSEDSGDSGDDEGNE